MIRGVGVLLGQGLLFCTPKVWRCITTSKLLSSLFLSFFQSGLWLASAMRPVAVACQTEFRK